MRRWCTHTPCRTHIFFAPFPCVTYRHEHAWLKGVCSVYVISLHPALSILMFHPPSLLFPHGHFDNTFPSAPSSSSFTRPQKRGPSASPHVRRGVWPPGRSHALDRTRKRGSPTLVAEDGNPDLGKCGKKNGGRKESGILLDLEGEAAHRTCSFMWADDFWIMSHSKENVEQMLRDLVVEASGWDLEPKPASLWSTSTYHS